MMRSAYESRFEQHLGALRNFAAREKHCNVPYAHVEDGIHLGRWVAYIRSRRRKDIEAQAAGGKAERKRIPDSYVEALEAIPSWDWAARRPGPTPKTSRNAEIRELRRNGVSLGVIAETYGLSKQRVHQLCEGEE